jgi:putative hydrolase of the HAD superfamily
MQNDYLKRIEPFLKQYSEIKPVKTNIQSDYKYDSNIKILVFDIYGTLIVSSSGDLDKDTATSKHVITALNQGGFFFVDVNTQNKNAGQLINLFHQTIVEEQNKLKQQNYPYPEVDIIKVWSYCINIFEQKNIIKRNNPTCIKTVTTVFEILSNKVWPMPEMNKVLNTLQQKDIPLGIVSNAQFYTPLIMNYFTDNLLSEDEFVNGFDSDISVFSYKLLRSKPDTYLFKLLAEKIYKKYNIKPAQVLFIGNDMLKDVWTAKQAGFKTALFAGDKRSLRLHNNDGRCKNIKPDFVLTELLQIFNIIK